MAQIRNFTSTNDSYFVLDGVSYPKVYEAMLDNGYTKDRIKLVGTNRDNSPLVFSTHYLNIKVDGVSFASAQEAISRLNEVVFSKGGGFGGGGTIDISSKQDVLVSGTNIKTVNGESILGAGNIQIEGSGGGTAPATTFDTQNNTEAASMKAISDYLLSDSPELIEIPITIRAQGSYISGAGNVLASPNWRTTELIDVLPGDEYVYFGRTNISTSAQSVAGYNTSDVFVSIILGYGINASAGVLFTVPAGVSKIRACSYMDTPIFIKKTEYVKKIKKILVPHIGVRSMPASWGAIGHSIWASDGTLTGIQTLVQRVFSFVSYSNYGYSGNSLAGTSSSDTTSILATGKTNTWQSKDIYTYDSITNDFKLNRPIGTQDDFLDNTGIGTYYGALRVLHEKLKSLNPNYLMIAANALKRNNADYTSWSANTAGHTLTDYSTALEWVCNRLSWRFINQFRDSGINDDNLGIFTSDGLHPNNLGYKRYADLWINEFEKIYRGT